LAAIRRNRTQLNWPKLSTKCCKMNSESQQIDVKLTENINTILLANVQQIMTSSKKTNYHGYSCKIFHRKLLWKKLFLTNIHLMRGKSFAEVEVLNHLT
jgi:hypothetical protein